MPYLHQKNIPPELDKFHPSEPGCLFLTSYVTFIVHLFIHLFIYFFELLINIHTAK